MTCRVIGKIDPDDQNMRLEKRGDNPYIEIVRRSNAT
jgi:hypothetical protein